ncbi:hypothetical protein RF11_07617 [Thelohanellus kitauei]|uniref:Uncharacterized protein n=1 Tax=Thelohanellus kitauei TaxID=669202 RepID=A0A0C2JZV4_THEKT|nr:hypothetical protein RF11_07617 [Thelohanellus kitauei]
MDFAWPRSLVLNPTPVHYCTNFTSTASVMLSTRDSPFQSLIPDRHPSAHSSDYLHASALLGDDIKAAIVRWEEVSCASFSVAMAEDPIVSVAFDKWMYLLIYGIMCR